MASVGTLWTEVPHMNYLLHYTVEVWLTCGCWREAVLQLPFVFCHEFLNQSLLARASILSTYKVWGGLVSGRPPGNGKRDNWPTQ